MQRGFVILLVLLSVAVTSAFALLSARRLQSLSEAAAPGGIALAPSSAPSYSGRGRAFTGM